MLMKRICHIAMRKLLPARRPAKVFPFVYLLLLLPFLSNSQAITGIITDYKGYWKSTTTLVNPVKPDNNHNLLAFTYNGQQYATGVNDELLASKGEKFVQGDFWSLPVNGMTGTINSNTKVGFGALYDGVYNGPSKPAPEYGIATYLTDGIKGLNIGTCIANLPQGSMSFLIQNIKPESIGDGIPDIIVTQIADPSGGSYDRYEFTDANGIRVGNYKDIIFTNITPVGTWTADFYEAIKNPLTLQSGFTQTDRPIRLWAADLSELGITATNYTQIKNFKINLCGNSDVAFVAYNNKSLNFQGALPVQYSFFKGSIADGNVQLSWQTVSEQNAGKYIIERSTDGRTFTAIDSVAARNKAAANNYTYIERNIVSGSSFYRLRQIDKDGTVTLSTIIKIENTPATSIMRTYPNPAKDILYVEYPAATDATHIYMHNASGILVSEVQPQKGSTRTKIDISHLTAGVYFLNYQNAGQKAVQRLVVE